MANVIVAGGANGIGRAAVRGFRARGDNVLLVDHRAQAADLVCEHAPGGIRFIQRDLAEPAAPEPAKSAHPSIILISSTGPLRGHAGMSAYPATKAALPVLCRSLTAELGPLGIRINALMGIRRTSRPWGCFLRRPRAAILRAPRSSSTAAIRPSEPSVMRHESRPCR